MGRPMWGFAGRTYHIVGNLMSCSNHGFGNVFTNDQSVTLVSKTKKNKQALNSLPPRYFFMVNIFQNQLFRKFVS